MIQETVKRLLRVARTHGVVVVGASEKAERASHQVLRSLKETQNLPGLVAVNPTLVKPSPTELPTIVGVPCYTSLKAVVDAERSSDKNANFPTTVRKVVCIFRSEPGPSVVEAVELGFRHFWLQYGVFLSDADKNTIAAELISMDDAPKDEDLKNELLLVEDRCLKVELNKFPDEATSANL
ncbi:unnamed protein product [Amoebophrya sp. A25]|nr:unnamed protein product [Amoebophrya sp. A25]|eukprot:GSA25T00009185001.1